MDDRHAPISRKPWLPFSLTLGVSLGLSALIVWQWQIFEQREQNRQRFEQEAQDIGQRVISRMQAYEMVLRGVSGLISGSDPVSQGEWARGLDPLQLQDRYPGILALAWSRYLRAEQLDTYLAGQQSQGRADYLLHPAGARAHYLLIDYISPPDWRNRQMLGYDMLSETVRRAAVERAIDSGQASLSAPVTLRQEVEANVQGGVLLFLPVYRPGLPQSTAEERRAALLGVVHGAFRSHDLIAGVLGVQGPRFDVAIKDQQAQQTSVFRAETQGVAPQPRFQHELELPLYGRNWVLQVSSTPAYEASFSSRGGVSLWGGLLAAALLLGGYLYVCERKTAKQRLRDQAEQLSLANRYKSEFLANMSHELRTPLNSILILSDQLRLNSTGNLTEKQARHADIVHRAGSDLLQLINVMLELGKVESGCMQLRLEPVSMQDILTELDISLRPLAAAKGLRLHTQLGAGVPAIILSDRIRLQQVLRNLLSNALKFTEHGEVSLTVSCASDGAQEGYEQLNCSVRDSGIGIPAEQHEQIFQAFQQIDGSTSRRFGGAGLGLTITRQLVLAMGGEISLQSVPGEGSCFTVQLPVRMVAQAQTEPPADAPQRSGDGLAVLIVEDDANFAAVLAEQAHGHGFSSVHCRSGGQAFNLLQSEHFSAVIVDIRLPDISGWQLVCHLRSQARHRSTPVHIISCVAQAADWDDHCTHYLLKPIQRVDLERVFVGLQQLDADVPAFARAAEPRQAYGSGILGTLMTDLVHPDLGGLEPLETLKQQSPRTCTQLVSNSGIDVTRQTLQRLRSCSAAVMHRHGEDTPELSEVVQGALGGECDSSRTGTPKTENPLEGRRVLLVDDDVRTIYALTALLDEAGLIISSARDGQKAIDCYEREPFDLILMGMAMPTMDGYTATRLLKTEHGCSIPIIAMTAHAMSSERERCAFAGTDDYLVKPVNREALQGLLLRWLVTIDPQVGLFEASATPPQ